MKHIDFLRQATAIEVATYRRFVKMHGLQNHFVIIDQRHTPAPIDKEDVVRICNPHIGVGGEQLLAIEAASEAAREAGAYARMRIFNIDGREVGACGNATRCVAHLLFEESGTDDLLIETAAGLLSCQKAGPMRVRVTFGAIDMDWRSLPLTREVDTLHLPLESGPLRDGVALSIGTPHAVFFVDDLGATDVTRYAPAIQHDPLFVEGTNVGVAEIVDDTTLRLVVWERPGILTKACGTGACVAVQAALNRGLIASRQVTVHLPAGPLEIEIRSDDVAVMTGPVAYCCHGFV